MPVGIIFAKQDYLVNVLFLNKKYFLERNTFFYFLQIIHIQISYKVLRKIWSDSRHFQSG